MTRYLSRLFLILAFAGTSLSAQRLPIQRELAFTPYHASGVYDVGETVGWTVAAIRNHPVYAYKWTIRGNNAVVLKEGRLDLSGGRTSIEVVVDKPEMIYVAIEAYAESGSTADAPARGVRRFEGGNAGRDTGFYAVGAAVAPWKIGLSTPRPADFDAFWQGKLAAQARVPVDPVLTPVLTAVPDVQLQMFQLDALGSKVHGYVARPSKEGKLPAIIQLDALGSKVHGYVARPSKEGKLPRSSSCSTPASTRSMPSPSLCGRPKAGSC